MTSKTAPSITELKVALKAGLISLEEYLKLTDTRVTLEVLVFVDTFHRVRGDCA